MEVDRRSQGSHDEDPSSVAINNPPTISVPSPGGDETYAQQLFDRDLFVDGVKPLYMAHDELYLEPIQLDSGSEGDSKQNDVSMSPTSTLSKLNNVADPDLTAATETATEIAAETAAETANNTPRSGSGMSEQSEDSVMLDPLDFTLDEKTGEELTGRTESSLLLEQDDPFTVREGKTLTWTSVNVTLKRTRNEPEQKILDNVWGEVPKQKTTAIMGASGSGKSSLLEVLAGRMTSNGKLKVDANVRLDNIPANPRKVKFAFMAQDDSLLCTATPRESIYFSAKLRLPWITTEKQLHKLTCSVLSELGLEDCADTVVGGALIKGISGGERRRTSIGVELVTKPSVICLDEPLSGLDSTSAFNVFQVLQKVADAGASVVFSIHQPSSKIFNGIDHLILMNKGKVVHQGAVSEIPAFFEECGYAIPPRYNPADWILDICQSTPEEELMEKGFFSSGKSEESSLAFKVEITRKRRSTNRSVVGLADTRHVGEIAQTKLLFQREAKSLYRNYIALGARLVFTVLGSLLVGAIMYGVGSEDRDEASNIQSQFGALVIVLLSSMVVTALPALLSFPEERPIFLREYSTNHYSVLSYFLSHFTMELVLTAVQILLMCLITHLMIGFQSSFSIYFLTTFALAVTSAAMAVLLGCAIKDPLLAQEMLPVLFIPQMLFAGFFVSPHLIPSWLRWIRYLCSLTFAVRILLVSEFDRDCGSVVGDTLCQYVLDMAEAESDEVWWNWLLLLLLAVTLRLVALLILKAKAIKYY